MLAACLAFRNTASYLREWLLFHLAVGFDHFYLYNNDSTDDFAPVLTPFRALTHHGAPLIELIEWPGVAQQLPIYNDCLRRAAANPAVGWLAFIDDDEFLYPATDQTMPDVLRAFEPYAGVAVCWQLYGSSGRIHYDDDWVIRRFTRRAGGPDQHAKCIVRPTRVVKALVSGHQFEPQPGFGVVDEKHRPLTTTLNPCPSADLLRINHYLTKSIEELVVRRTSREIDVGDKNKLPLLEWVRLDRNWNAVEDRSAQRLEPRMRQLAAELNRA
jgi:hypothetical protein